MYQIQFYTRNDRSSIDYVGNSIFTTIKGWGWGVSRFSLTVPFEDNNRCKNAEVGLAWGLPKDMRCLKSHKIRIGGLVCEKELTEEEIDFIKDAQLHLILVPSQFCVEKFSKAGFINLGVFPHGLLDQYTHFSMSDGQIKPYYHGRRTNRLLMIFNSYQQSNFHVKRKGIFELLEILPRLDPKLKVIIRSCCRNYYADYDLSKTEWIEKRVDDLSSIINNCDAALCPSHAEGFGLVGLESLARGIPLITTKTGNDYLEDDITFVDVGLPVTAESIGGAIIEFYNKYNEYQSKALEQRLQIIKRYKLEDLIKEKLLPHIELVRRQV